MTILFLEDWNDYPDAIVDYKTKNKSFIRYAALLNSMGVKNYAFCLQLHNPELQGVDPHSKHLTVKQMAMITQEVKVNPFYFLREVARLPGSTDEIPIAYNAHRGNIAALWLYLNHITYILIQIRQTGKSVGSDFNATWVINFAATHYTYTLLTKNDKLRASNLERLREIERELPFFLRMRKKTDIGNTEEMHISRLHNKYKGHLPNKNPKLANLVARGETSGTVQCDEAAFFANIGITIPAALPATTAASKIHARKGEPYGIFFTTTAGKKDDPDGRYVFDMVQDAAVWSELFMDCQNIEDLKRVILGCSKSKDPTVNLTFNHRQLGFTDEWLKDTVQRVRSTGDDAERDFGNIWTSGSLSSPITPRQAEIIRKSEQSDFKPEITSPYGYVLRWYEELHMKEKFLLASPHTLGMDGSEGQGRDSNTLHLRNIYTGKTVMAFDVSEINLLILAEFIGSIMLRYKKILFVPERKNSGVFVIDCLTEYLLAHGEDPFARIFNRVVQEKDEYPDRFEPLAKPQYLRPPNICVAYKKYFGFNTAGSGQNARSELYGECFSQAVDLTGHLVHDKKTIDQLVALQLINGRIDHAPGEHDDSVIAWLLSFWPLIRGKNLDFYGIDSRDILRDNTIRSKQIIEENSYDNIEQSNFRAEIDELTNQLKRERNETICRLIENRITHLSSKLKTEDRQMISADQLIRDLRQQRSGFHRRY